FVTLQGGARMGEGRLAIDGRVDLSGLPDWRAEIDLKGDNLTALRLPEASVQASPDLKIALRPGEARVTGRVEVPEALFDLGGEKPAAARVSPDVRIVGEEEAVAAQALDAHVELVLGDKVRVRGKGFNGRIAGRLEVIDRPGLPSPVGQGELTIPEGRYKAYGQDLVIEQGRIIYADTPLDDPALDIRAVRRAILDGTVAGVRITGRASRPVLAMFSEPAMEQAEVLSYLVTGRPLSKGSGSDAALMVQAARAAGYAGGDLLAGQIGGAFGLEEATIESDVGTEELSLVLGRYLTPRLYLRYVQGLEEGLQTFALRYELTRHFNVQVQSGVKAGVDVFYSFER
ncbi:MAG TPA: translocation/assembly module TamB, partial [Chromatiales bacterium]|nr:translocation/assembly module TamB [Chromatiales bacterium]